MAGGKHDLRGLLGIVSVLIGWLLVVLPRVINDGTARVNIGGPNNAEISAPPAAPAGDSTSDPFSQGPAARDSTWGQVPSDRTASTGSSVGGPTTTNERTTDQPERTPAGGSLPGWPAKVIGISDGDTIDVLNADNQKLRLRLNAIDCPETGQPFGSNAKQFVSQRVGGQMVRIVERDRDRYGRIVAEVYDASSQSLNVALVRAGLAWHYKAYAADRKDVAAAESEARTQLRGLWSGSHRPIAPWDWRQLSRLERDRYR